jgi:4-amino-4-deoxy-L-arabinose transferase-like glycosyltransferase
MLNPPPLRQAPPIYSLPSALLLVALLTAARIFALYHTGHELFYDEAQYRYWAQYPAFGYYSKPPTVAWLIALTTHFCGNGEPCVRLASPLLHAGTALFVYGIARTLFREPGIAFWSAVVYITLPAVFLSSGLISTDPPLLFFWAGTLFFFGRAVLSPRALPNWIACGIFAGLGMLSKYNMAVFAFGALAYLWTTPYRRYVLAKPGFWLAGGIAFLIFLPNVLWNAMNGFASFLHTKDNAQIEKASLHVGNFAEFVFSQFGVFGPILFGTLVVALCCRDRKASDSPHDGLLAWQIVPMLALISCIALLSRAHANWAAPAYVAACVYVVRYLYKTERKYLIYASVLLHVALAALAVALPKRMADADGWRLAGRTNLKEHAVKDPLLRLAGGRELGARVAGAWRRHGSPVLLTGERSVHALLSYYSGVPHEKLRKWNPDKRMRDHFDLTASLPEDATDASFLLVSTDGRAEALARYFTSVTLTETLHVGPYAEGKKTYYVYLLGRRKDGP